MFKIATFNCENLFSRNAYFAAPTAQKRREVINNVELLNAELQREVFDADRIEQLEALLTGYAHIETRHGSIRQGTRRTAWAGDVVFDRKPVDDAAVTNLGAAIRTVDADVWCLQEIESRDTLRDFWNRHVAPVGADDRFPSFLCFDGNDKRGIDVAIVSRFPVVEIRSHMLEWHPPTQKPVFSRDCLEVVVTTPVGDVRVLVNHFRSKRSYPGDPAGTDEARRHIQAARVAQIVELRGGPNAPLLVAGDLNQEPGQPDVAPLFTHPALHDLKGGLPAGGRWTYGSEKYPEEIDHLLATPALANRLQGVTIDRRWLFGFSGRVPSVTSRASAASDHAPVVATFG